MKTLISAVLVFLFTFSTITSSQTIEPEKFSNYLKSGRWAVQFELGTFINPDYFQGIELSIKPQLGSSSALKLGVGFNRSTLSGTTRQENLSKPKIDEKNSFSVSLTYIHYFNPKDRVCFFAGFGPLYTYDDVKQEYSNIYRFGSSTTIYETYNSSKQWSVGGRAIMGIEWFLHERVSLLAEYNMEFLIGKYNGTTTSKTYYTFEHAEIEVRDEALDVTNFRFNIVKIGLSAYF
ncbi:MAG: hypothetical protein IAE90_14945 [Ignavibacteria bacterium]|mgnify:CR=1 FL=1|nr:hypothetical protein [Ignavibacteria bacterium]